VKQIGKVVKACLENAHGDRDQSKDHSGEGRSFESKHGSSTLMMTIKKQQISRDERKGYYHTENNANVRNSDLSDNERTSEEEERGTGDKEEKKRIGIDGKS